MGTYKTPVCYGIYRHPDCDIFAHPCNISLFMIAFNSVKERKKKHAFFPRRSRGDRHASTRMHSLPMQKTKNKSYRNHSYTVKLKPVQIPLQKFKRLGGKKKKKNCLISKCEGGELMHCGGVERGGRMSFGHKEVQESWHVRVIGGSGQESSVEGSEKYNEHYDESVVFFFSFVPLLSVEMSLLS